MTDLVRVVGVGAVGARVARSLLAAEQSVTVEVDDIRPDLVNTLVPSLGDRASAVRHYPPGTIDPETRVPRVIVLAQPRPHLAMATAALEAGITVVSVCDDLDDVRNLMALDRVARRSSASLVVGAALSPGLSGLIARHLSARLDRLDEIHVAIHGTGGPECAMQHHRALGGTSLGWHDRAWVERPAGSGRELAWFPEPLGAKDCYRAEMADPILLPRAFPEVERAIARMSATRRDRLTARLPMLTPPHPEGGLGGLRVEVRGEREGQRVALVAGVAERTAIAAAQVAAVFALAAVRSELPHGLLIPGDAALPTQLLLDRLSALGLSLQEFVGSEAYTSW